MVESGSKEASINGQRRRLPGLIEYRRVVRMHTRMHSLSTDEGVDIRPRLLFTPAPWLGYWGEAVTASRRLAPKNKKTNIRGGGM